MIIRVLILDNLRLRKQLYNNNLNVFSLYELMRACSNNLVSPRVVNSIIINAIYHNVD